MSSTERPFISREVSLLTGVLPKSCDNIELKSKIQNLREPPHVVSYNFRTRSN